MSIKAIFSLNNILVILPRETVVNQLDFAALREQNVAAADVTMHYMLLMQENYGLKNGAILSHKKKTALKGVNLIWFTLPFFKKLRFFILFLRFKHISKCDLKKFIKNRVYLIAQDFFIYLDDFLHDVGNMQLSQFLV